MKKEDTSSRKTTDSLDQCLDRLRDLHLNYKDLSSRCLVEINTQNKNDKRVFYFKPDTFLLDDPEKQRQARDKLLKKITALPTPEPISFMGDDLHKALLESIQDKSHPSICKNQLAKFYKRRQYHIQHKKYKLLIRWAHHAIATENIERVGHEATQKYAKWEYDMENAIKRYERLDFDDGFDTAKPSNRPNTKAKEGGSLYVENSDLEPMSIIRQDDIEVYLRTVTYEQRVNQIMSKFLARLKWLPLYRRFEIWTDAVEAFNQIRDANLGRQEVLIEKIRAKGESIIPADHEDQLLEFQEIMKHYFVVNYKNKVVNKAEKIMATQKSDHQLAPTMIGNILELKVNIVEKALEYGIYGDIELDQGYSFAYQITIFFPTYFQKQIIQSQFSLYDAFAGEEQDLNSVQKRNLQNMVKIDTNIFKDISTTKNNVPSQEYLNTDPSFQNIKVTRLKSCAYWIDYVCVFPKVPAHSQKQAALLATDNPIDSLLKSALNFLDVNDLATVNKILEETARLHQQQQKELAMEQKGKANGKNNSKTEEKEKSSLTDMASSIRNHFSSAIQGEIGKQDNQNPTKGPLLNNLSLKHMPQHLITAFYILRHMKSRDYKIKLLYCLNYFRSVQKRLMLDLREFGTRERIYGDQVQPYIAATESSRAAQRNVSTNFAKTSKEQQKINSISERLNKSQLDSASQDAPSASTSERQQSYMKQAELNVEQEKIFNIINEEDVDQTEPNVKLYDMKQYKYKGKFCNKIYSTCPVVPRFHSTFGEPVEFQPMNVEFERIGNAKHISDEGVKLLGRVDHVEISEKTREVHIKDDFGIYVLYECAMQDMKDLEEELLKIGSYYISKHEYLINTEIEKAYPLVDRISLLEDLLNHELDFQFEKVKLIQCYIEAYEHISDPLEQQRLIQVVVDLMAQRPRLNLTASYFIDSYEAERICLNKHSEIMRTMIVNQMKIEKEENKKIQAYLDMTLRMTQEHSKGKWKYVDAEDFFNELKKRKETAMSIIDEQSKHSNRGGPAGGVGSTLSNMAGGLKEESIKTSDQHMKEQSMSDKDGARDQAGSATQKFMQKQVEKNHASKYSKETAHAKEANHSALSHKESEGGFAAVLGLPTITVETLYQQYKEKDEAILEFMNEHANYVKLYEGYPEFLVDLQGLQSSKLSNYKFSDWSFPINVLDFFESLSFAPKFYATIQSILSELVEAHKPHNASLMAMLEFKILERAEIEYQKVKAFYDGDLQEYKGQDLLEDEAIIGNADKITFHIKDMMSNLTKAQKQNINPFIIGKLDIDTVTFFDFPSLPKESNQYLQKPAQSIQQDFEAAVKIAENNSKQSNAAQSRYFANFKELMRKINVPQMLTLYCNAVELLRLRQELITSMSESMVLQEIYEAQAKLVNRPNFKAFFTDSVKFDNYKIDQSVVNFIDDGPAAFVEFDLAIREFDAVLKSNLNFRNPDAVKMLITTAGLEELRGVLHYQLMHKQLLIIGVRLNQLMLDTHQRALNELELARRGFGVPNSVIRVQQLFCKTGDGFSNEQYMKMKTNYANNLSNNAANVFYQLTQKKAKMRNTISKKFLIHLQTTAQKHRKTETCLRIMRAFKIRLLHAYCIEIMRDAYHDSVKIQAVATCQRLRTLSQVFQIDESVVGVLNFPIGKEQAQVFALENQSGVDFYENFFQAYNPLALAESGSMAAMAGNPAMTGQPARRSAINSVKMEITDYAVIPSTITLMRLDSLTPEESQSLQEKYPNLLDSGPKLLDKSEIFDLKTLEAQQEREKEMDDCDRFVKQIIPTIEFEEPEYPHAGDKDRYSLRINDFKQSYDYTNSAYGQIFSYYAMLERIFKFEFSLIKINASLQDALALEDAINTGMPFWSIDPEAAITKRRQQDAQNNNANGNGSSKSTNQTTQNTQKLSERVIEKIVAEKRAKVTLAEEIVNLSGTIGQILERAQQMYDVIAQGKTSSNYVPLHRINEFLISHQEFRFYNLVHVIERLIDGYYQKEATKEIKFLTDLHSQLTKRDNVKLSFQHNAFHVNAAYTRPDNVSLECANYFGYYSNYEEEQGFQSCIQPNINEKALNPPQITLLEGIYGPPMYRYTQYAGQIPHYPSVYPMLDTAFINMNESERQYINSTLHSVRMLVKDYLEVIHKEKLNGDTFEEGASIDQLRKCSKFLSDLIKARQLKVALMCWISSSTLPLDPKVYNYIFTQYKNDIFWKIMNKKDSLPPISGLKQFEAEITQQGKNNQGQESTLKKAEGSMIQNQQLMLMQAQVLVEQVQTCRAEIMVLQNEIHRNIIKAAIQAIETETAAIANCFTMTANQIESHIHPFQQFASTLYSRVDPNSHLDMVTKLSEVQRFITKLQNRGTEVETLTSGPGMVFTIKDFNECVQILCRGLIKYSEREMRARSENFAKKEAHYINLLYMKDRKIENLESRIANTQENLDKLINSKMYEKGNQLIYELDNVNRQLKLFKDNVFVMERELKQRIHDNFKEELRRQRGDMEHIRERFQKFKEDVVLKVNAEVTVRKDEITKAITKKAEDYKNKEFGQPSISNTSGTSMMAISSGSPIKSNGQYYQRYSMVNLSPAKAQQLNSAINQQKQMNSGNSSQTSGNNVGYLDEIMNMTEIHARMELAEMWREMRTLRMFWKFKEMITKDKYEREIFILKKQLTSNACLWEQLAEAEKREKVLKQELVFTQQSLAASEKVIDKLKDDLRKSESDRIRLSQYKTSKAQRLEELESKVRKFEVMDNINLEKLIDALGNKERQIQKLRDIESNFTERVTAIEKKKDSEVKEMKNQYLKELGMKKEVLERLEGLRMELRLLEKNEGSMTEVWKSKCKELVEICNKLKGENDNLRAKITQIAMNLSSYGGISNGGDLDLQQSTYRQQSMYDATPGGGNTTQFTLPKLMNNTQNRITSKIQSSKYGGHTTSVTGTHTRQSSIHKPQDSHLLASPAQTILEMSTSAHHNQQQQLSQSKDYSTTSKHIRGRSTHDGGINPLSNITTNAGSTAAKLHTNPQNLGKQYNVFTSHTTSHKSATMNGGAQQVFGSMMGQQP